VIDGTDELIHHDFNEKISVPAVEINNDIKNRDFARGHGAHLFKTWQGQEMNRGTDLLLDSSRLHGCCWPSYFLKKVDG
jgi:hypothetical protein